MLRLRVPRAAHASSITNTDGALGWRVFNGREAHRLQAILLSQRSTTSS
jgi:hypothetical protein